MRFNRKMAALLGVLALLIGVLGAGALLGVEPLAALANELTDGEEDELEGADMPITDEAALQQASDAALQYARDNGLGEGRVTGTEVGDEEGYYEIELRLENGRQVDIHLDEAFNVLGREGDDGEDD